jgi:hypothetical protein
MFAVDNTLSIAGSFLGCEQTSTGSLEDNSGLQAPRTAGSNLKAVKDGFVLQARLCWPVAGQAGIERNGIKAT